MGSLIDIKQILFKPLKNEIDFSKQYGILQAFDYIEAVSKFFGVISISVIKKYDYHQYEKIIKYSFSNKPSLGHYIALSRESFTKEMQKKDLTFNIEVYQFLKNILFDKKNTCISKINSILDPQFGKTLNTLNYIELLQEVIGPYRNVLIGHSASIRQEDDKYIEYIVNNLSEIIDFSEKIIGEFLDKVEFRVERTLNKDCNESYNHIYMYFGEDKIEILPLLSYFSCQSWSCEQNHKNKMFFYNGEKNNIYSYLDYLYSHWKNVSSCKTFLPSFRTKSSNLNITTSDDSEIERHTDFFTGREHELDELKNFLDGAIEKNTSGYAIIGGSPGIGKTAFMSYFVTKMQKNENLQTYLYYKKKHADENDFFDKLKEIFSSYISNAEEQNEEQSIYNILNKAFINFNHNSDKHILIMLDGLDEFLAPEMILKKLPIRNFNKIHFIFSTRFNKKVFSLFNELKYSYALHILNSENISNHKPSIEIGTLTLAEMQTILYSLFPKELTSDAEHFNRIATSIMERSEGLPLYLHYISEQYKWFDSTEFETKDILHEIEKWAYNLPRSINELYTSLFDDKVLVYLLNLLYWSKNGLKFDELYLFATKKFEQLITSTEDFENKYFNRILVFLTLNENKRFNFYHKSLYDSITNYYKEKDFLNVVNELPQYFSFRHKEHSDLLNSLNDLINAEDQYSDLVELYEINGFSYNIERLYIMLGKHLDKDQIPKDINNAIEVFLAKYKNKTLTSDEINQLLMLNFMQANWNEYYGLVQKKEHEKIKDLFLAFDEKNHSFDCDILIKEKKFIKNQMNDFLQNYLSQLLSKLILSDKIEGEEDIKKIIPFLCLLDLYNILMSKKIQKEIHKYTNLFFDNEIFYAIKYYAIYEAKQYRSELELTDFDHKVLTFLDINFQESSERVIKEIKLLNTKNDLYLTIFVLLHKTILYTNQFTLNSKYKDYIPDLISILEKSVNSKSFLDDVIDHYQSEKKYDLIEKIVLEKEEINRDLRPYFNRNRIDRILPIKWVLDILREESSIEKIYQRIHATINRHVKYIELLINFYIDNKELGKANFLIDKLNGIVIKNKYLMRIAFQQNNLENFLSLNFESMKIKDKNSYFKYMANTKSAMELETILTNEKFEDWKVEEAFRTAYLTSIYRISKTEFYDLISKYIESESVFNISSILKNIVETDDVKRLNAIKKLTIKELNASGLNDREKLEYYFKYDAINQHEKDVVNSIKNEKDIVFINQIFSEYFEIIGNNKNVLNAFIKNLFKLDQFEKIIQFDGFTHLKNDFISNATTLEKIKFIENNCILSSEEILTLQERNYILDYSTDKLVETFLHCKDEEGIKWFIRVFKSIKYKETLGENHYIDICHKLIGSRINEHYVLIYDYFKRIKFSNALELIQKIELNQKTKNKIIEDYIAVNIYENEQDLHSLLQVIQDENLLLKIQYKHEITKELINSQKVYELLSKQADSNQFIARLSEFISHPKIEDAYKQKAFQFLNKPMKHEILLDFITRISDYFENLSFKKKVQLLYYVNNNGVINYLINNMNLLVKINELNLIERYHVYSGIYKEYFITLLKKGSVLDKHFKLHNEVSFMMKKMSKILKEIEVILNNEDYEDYKKKLLELEKIKAYIENNEAFDDFLMSINMKKIDYITSSPKDFIALFKQNNFLVN